MISFPNCKINLGLIIAGKRDDGYHNIETVFYPVHLNDILEIIYPASGLPGPVFTQSGIFIDGNAADNLCLKAWHLLKKDFPLLPSTIIHLHKVIPIGAGLGGGSADAAFTLILLNQTCGLNLSEDQLLHYALQLGSDCPFFILNRPYIARGRGEILQRVDLQLAGYRLILVNPGIHVNTGWAFAQLNINAFQPEKVHTDRLPEVISLPVTSWKEELVNDFEAPVFKKHNEILRIKEALYEKGALFASLSGSGSTVYGIFDSSIQPSFSFPQNYMFYNILLQ